MVPPAAAKASRVSQAWRSMQAAHFQAACTCCDSQHVLVLGQTLKTTAPDIKEAINSSPCRSQLAVDFAQHGEAGLMQRGLQHLSEALYHALGASQEQHVAPLLQDLPAQPHAVLGHLLDIAHLQVRQVDMTRCLMASAQPQRALVHLRVMSST